MAGLLVAVATLPIMRRHNAPRLRERRRLELSLANDARERTWPREVERHCAIARRIEQLLSDLGEEVE